MTLPVSRRSTSVAVPVRALEGAKSRLGAVLDAEERRDLVVGMLQRTVAAALAAPGVIEVIVVSPDPEALLVAQAAGARPLLQQSRGLNPAFQEARSAAGGDRLLLLPADLPTITPESTAMSKDLKKRGWKFVGPTTVYAFMQAMGMVNDHEVGCPRYKGVREVS